jgi:serine/threonine protein kinase
MKRLRFRVLKVGERIGDQLTVLGLLDKRRRHPVYIVWHDRAWCPMACKAFRSLRKARREAEFLSALCHPNIVRLLGVGKPAHLLTEFLEGPTLSQLLDSKPRQWLSVADSVRVAIHLGSALAHVHDRGLLHLDVKPSNVIIAHGRPVLFDFGSARRQDEERPPYPAGTEGYIAPEEYLRRKVTPAADVYALGVTLYEMLLGDMPFPVATSRNPHPGLRRLPDPIRPLRPAVPMALEQLVMRCLARDPADRPTLATLLPALHEFTRSGPRMWPENFQPNFASRRHRSSAPAGRNHKQADPRRGYKVRVSEAAA